MVFSIMKLQNVQFNQQHVSTTSICMCGKCNSVCLNQIPSSAVSANHCVMMGDEKKKIYIRKISVLILMTGLCTIQT